MFTGVLAGLTALVAAGFIYRAAKLPIEAERDQQVERKKVMKSAGAAQLLNAVTTIYLSVISEAGKRERDRLGKFVVTGAVPSLETISTQDKDVVHQLCDFLVTASKYEAHLGLETWPYDPDKTHQGEKEMVDDLTAKMDKLGKTLTDIIALVVT